MHVESMNAIHASFSRYNITSKRIIYLAFFYQLAFCGFLNTLSIFFIAQNKGLHEAFRLSLGYIGLAAFTSIFFGFLVTRIVSYRYIVAFGLLLCSGSLTALGLIPEKYQLLGIAGLCVGTGMYVSNINIIFNRQFSNNMQRQQGQHFKYLASNLAAIISFITFSLMTKIWHNLSLFRYSHLFFAAAMLCGFLLFCSQYKSFQNSAEVKKQNLLLFHLFVIVFICLISWIIRQYNFVSITSCILCLFSIIYLLRQYKKYKNTGYITVLCLIFFAGLTYWIGVGVYQVVTPSLIAIDNATHIAPTSIMLLNPIVVVLFGYAVIQIYKKKSPKPILKIYLGLIINLFSYLALTLALSLFNKSTWVIVMFAANIALVAVSEYLVGTTMNVYINQFTKRSHDAILMGMLRAFRGTAFVFAYLFFSAIEINVNNNSVASTSYKMVASLSGLTILSLLALWTVKKFMPID